MVEEQLSIKELKYNIKELEKDLDLYLTLKKVNFEKTQPGSIKYKDVITNGTTQFDKFTHYIIKDEKYDDKIISLQKSINAYEKRLIDKIASLSSGSPKALITYLREEEKMSWKSICNATHYSDKQARRIYKN